MSLQTSQFYEFSEFRLDLSEKVLLHDGKPIPLTPKVFETLEVLIGNAGHLIKKDELMRTIWQDRFVEENNLTFNIKMLRKALGDDAANPRFIETVPRRGYRFIAQVRKVPAEKSFVAPIAADSAESSASRKFYLPVIASGIIFILVIVGGAWWWKNKFLFPAASDAPILSAAFHSEKFSNSGRVAHSAISPDGKIVAFVDSTNGKNGIWLRRLETSDNVQIVPSGDDFYGGILFAHDGQTLYFMRKPADEVSPSAIYRVSIFGGVPEKILENTEGWFSLSPDDRQISFVRCEYQEDNFCSLLTADSSGQNERKLLTRPHPIRIGDNQFSPDGKRIAFAVGQSWDGGTDFRLKQFDLESKTESDLSAKTFFNIKNIKWLTNGDGLLLTVKENLNGKLKIWQVSTETGEANPVSNDVTDYLEISLDKNDDKMIATQVKGDFHLCLFRNNNIKTLITASDFTFTPGGKIVYSSEDSNLWIINSDGGEQHQLTNNPANDFQPHVTADNRFIFFTSNRSGSNQVWRMDIDGSSQMQITEKEGGYPRFVSPDGKWVYYESGFHQTLRRASTAGGEETQVLERKISGVAFSPNGNLAAYFFRDKENDNLVKIAVMTIADRKIIKTLNYGSGKSQSGHLAWLNDNRTLDFTIYSEGKNWLWQQSLDENKPRLITNLDDGEIEDFAAAPDGSVGFVRGSWLFDAILINGLK